MMQRLLTAAIGFAALGLPSSAQELALDYQKFELDNGLDVVLHEDHSDPVVAVYVYYHVGSGREELGRSGFAHLFEHMMFQGSENVGDDQHFKYVQEAGGTLNGTTALDRTMYYEVLPSNQLEVALWLEADRMGFLLPAMTQEKLDNQREVVKNERRQNYENRPYGLVYETLARNLYPHGHPYSWTTIGSMEDLSAASMEDVGSFFRRWYGPNNATIAIGGDIDPEATLALVERYFGSIPRGPEVDAPEPRPITLASDKRIVLEDKVQLPQLSWTWTTVPMEHQDEAALDLLASALSANRSAILDKALTVDEELVSMVSAGNQSSELAGQFTITVRSQPGVHVDDIAQRVEGLLAQVATEGIQEERLTRLKNRYEAQLVRGLETVSSRTRVLAEGNLYHDQPDHLKASLARTMAVTADDVQRVCQQYLIGRPSVCISVVPEGRADLAYSGRTPEQRVAEAALDRTVKPGAAEAGSFGVPEVWRTDLPNGVEVVGTRFEELPLSRFALSLPAGRLNESMDTLGLASLTAAMLEEGTANLSGTELQDAFDALGATFNVSSGVDEIQFVVSALDKHLPAAVALTREVLLSPRFAEADFARVQKEALTRLGVRGDNIRAMASDAWARLLHGAESVLGQPGSGTEETIASLSVEDVRSFWKQHARPDGARLTYVGGRDAAGVAELFADWTEAWPKTGEAGLREASFRAEDLRWPERTTIYLVDKPGAAQSEIRIGHPSLSSADPKAWDAFLVNYPLGGSFSSRINLNLREDKGYTYGARSGFPRGLYPGAFTASAGVRTDVTAASVTEFLKELRGIHDGITEEELAFARESITQSMGRQFESTSALLRFVEDISYLGRPVDFPAQRLARLGSVTKAELDALARELIDTERLFVLVVGDKAEVLEGLQGLGLGDVVELDRHGEPL